MTPLQRPEYQTAEQAGAWGVGGTYRENQAEEAARQYEAALHDFYYDAQPEAPAYHPIAMLIGLLFFATICFCVGTMLAVSWSFYDEVPARGVMDGVR